MAAAPDAGAGGEPQAALILLGKPINARQPPRLVVCCGLPASGKSWTAQQLEQHKGYARVCQDDLGSRSACEDALGAGLRRGGRVVVDRCNPTRQDRAHWLAMAHSPSPSLCLYFSAGAGTCRPRAEQRQRQGQHPTLSTPGRVAAALKHFEKELEAPTLKGEQFSTVALVPSFAAAQDLLVRVFGVPRDSLPQEEEPPGGTAEEPEAEEPEAEDAWAEEVQDQPQEQAP